MKTKTLKVEDITIIIDHYDMDNACDSAYSRAATKFCSGKLKEWDRKTCSIEVEFQSFKMVSDVNGLKYVYNFKAVAYLHNL